MQEIKKRRIVLASVLKPVTETRMCEKLGLTLAESYDVHIIGFHSRELSTSQSLHLHALKHFRRLSINRVLAPFRIMRKILSLKPDVLIVCTHELLIVGVIVKLFTRCKLIYDVQENYQKNVLYTNAFPLILRPLLGLYVRIKEWSVSPLVDLYFLAEVGYVKEISFPRQRFIILENKLKRPAHVILPRKRQHNGKLHLLFTGTLADSTGVFTAIDLATHLYGIDHDIQLLIIGFCSQPAIRLKLERLARVLPFIEVITGDVPIPHEQILAAVQQADVGIISYPPNPATASAVPTKLYEYLGYQLPILLVDHEPWKGICERYAAAVIFYPESPNPERILQELNSKTFYSSVPEDVFWDSEAEKLIYAIDSLLS